MKTLMPKKTVKIAVKRNNWEELKGIWKNKDPDPMVEWRKTRKEWEYRMKRLEKLWNDENKKFRVNQHFVPRFSAL